MLFCEAYGFEFILETDLVSFCEFLGFAVFENCDCRSTLFPADVRLVEDREGSSVRIDAKGLYPLCRLDSDCDLGGALLGVLPNFFWAFYKNKGLFGPEHEYCIFYVLEFE